MITELYRHFDKDGVLLYVGISKSAFLRATQHRDASHWFSSAVTMTTERFQNRKEALEAETKAIKEEKPLHNIMHKEEETISKTKMNVEDLDDWDGKIWRLTDPVGKYQGISGKWIVLYRNHQRYKESETFDTELEADAFITRLRTPRIINMNLQH